MVSQSRRYYRSITQFREAVRGLGRVGAVTAEFFRAPHFGGFRDEMAHPLLIDMAIHHFDAFRYLIDDEPVSVSCDEFNPAWSWYQGDAGVTAELRHGERRPVRLHRLLVQPRSEHVLERAVAGQRRARHAHSGTARPCRRGRRKQNSTPADPGVIPEEFAGSLAEFIGSLRTGTPPGRACGSNVRSLAMVEAAIESAATGTRVSIPDVIDRALAHAIDVEANPDTANVLRQWQKDGLPRKPR